MAALPPAMALRSLHPAAPVGGGLKRRARQAPQHASSLDRPAPRRLHAWSQRPACRASENKEEAGAVANPNGHPREPSSDTEGEASSSKPTDDSSHSARHGAESRTKGLSREETSHSVASTSKSGLPKDSPETTGRAPDAGAGGHKEPGNTSSSDPKEKANKLSVMAAQLFARASKALKGEGTGRSSGGQQPQQDLAKQAASSMLSGAVSGTVAVTLGYLLHVNPLASFHIDEGDLALAAAAAVPLIAIDYVVNVLVLQGSGRASATSVVLLPEEKLLPALLRKRKVKQLEPAKQAPKGSKASRQQELLKTKTLISETLLKPKSQQTEEDELASLVLWQWLRAQGLDGGVNLIGTCPDVKVQMPIGCPQVDVVKEAMVARAERRALLEPSASQPLWLETVVIMVDQLGKAMFAQGFVLTIASGWLTDRLYEAGMDDVITLGPLELTLSQLSMLTYIGGFAIGIIIRDMRAIRASQEKLRDNHWRLNLMLLERGQWSRQERSLYWKFEKNLEKKFLAKKMKLWRQVTSATVRNVVFIATGNLAASVTVMYLEKISFAIIRRAVSNILKDAMNKQKGTGTKTGLVTAEAAEAKQDSD